MSKPNNQFVYIVGPTAAGKTALSLACAETLNWPIINCDSLQVYQQLNIGTAKPSPQEFNLATHYLFDYVKPPGRLTAAEYLDDVVSLIDNKNIEKAMFVGGSGFYVQALEKGLFPNSEPNPKLLKQVDELINELGFEGAHNWLAKKDPQSAVRISVNDHYRLRRAVEVILGQGKSLSQLNAEMADGSYCRLPVHKSLKVGLTEDRSLLRKKVEKRTSLMLAQGFVEEVQTLVNQGFENWPPMLSVGYKEVQAFLRGEISEAELPEKIVTATMQLIKKQMTWFKRDSDIRWFSPDEHDKARAFIVSWSKQH